MTANEDADVEREVVEETVEETEVLDQSDLPHEERREQEREALAGGGEVSLTEGEWHPHSDDSLEAIREAVDDLEVPEGHRHFDPVPPTPEVHLPEARDAPEAPSLSGERSDDVAPLSRSDREAVDEAFDGELVQAVALYDARQGRVIRALLDREAGLEEEKAILRDGEVQDLGSIVDDVDRIGADVDLAAVDLGPAEPEEPDLEDAEEPDDEAEDATEDGGLRDRVGGLLGGDEDEAEEAEPAAEPEEAGDLEAEDEPEATEADDEAEEDGGGLRDRVGGLLGGDEDEAEEADEEATEADEPTEEADEGDDEGLRDRVGGLLGGDEDEADDEDAAGGPDEDAGDDTAQAEDEEPEA